MEESKHTVSVIFFKKSAMPETALPPIFLFNRMIHVQLIFRACFLLSLLTMVSVLSSCHMTDHKGFTDVTRQSGIDFRYNFGDCTYVNIMESSGSGITVMDYNGDDWPDLYMLNGTWLEGISDPEGKIFQGTPDRLYVNRGDGTFYECAEKAGLDDRNWSMAATAIDYNLDGYEDIFLLNYGPNKLYRNNGDGTYTDIAEAVGLEGPEKLNGFTKWSIGASFWDINRDGRLDVMVGNFLAFDPAYISFKTPGLMPHPSEYMGQASLLYIQREDGTFTDSTESYGLYYPDSKCMGMTAYDYDEDGDLDLFQANDHQANFLFRNEGGHFREVGAECGVAVNSHGLPTGSMHGALGDVDGDGLTDIFVPDLSYGALYRNLGNGLFEDITEKSGLLALLNGMGQWGAALFDYDNDGDPDIFCANGVAEELVEQLPLLLENDGHGHFSNVGPERGAYFREKRSGRGAAVWDYDNDGDLDIIVSHVDLQATPALLRNDLKSHNHWLGLKLYGKAGPATAIAARVVVHAGSRKMVFVNQWTTSYLTNNDPRVHIGLGKNKMIDSLEIFWSDGNRDVITHLPGIDRYLKIYQGAGVEEKIKDKSIKTKGKTGVR